MGRVACGDKASRGRGKAGGVNGVRAPHEDVDGKAR
jgi:hypothetical protein